MSLGFKRLILKIRISQAVSKTCTTCIQYKIPDDGQKTCPKHVEFYCKNKFEKLVHLFGFITRIYHDARSSECQTMKLLNVGDQTCTGRWQVIPTR